MKDLNFITQELASAIEGWIRSIIKDEMERTLAADHQKQKPSKQYSRDETAKILGVSLMTLWNMEQRGQIKATRIGRRVLFDESEIKRILENGCKEEEADNKHQEKVTDNRVRNLIVNSINDDLCLGFWGIPFGKAEILYIRHLTSGHCDYMTIEEFVEFYKTDIAQKRKKEYLRDHPTVDINLQVGFKNNGYELDDF